MIYIKSKHEIELMNDSGTIAAETMMRVLEAIKPGVTTWELDRIAENYIRKAGAVPSFKNYCGYPASICASVNEEVVHGIPSKKRVLKEGDIISIDLGAIYKGYHSDMARTKGVGKISEDAETLIRVTRDCFFRSLEFAEVGNHIQDIGAAVERYAESYGYGVVKALEGHGVGRQMHEDPGVPNFVTGRRGARLRAGMTIAIEPMINLGTDEVYCLDDDWTQVTADGSLAAHYENTVAITEDGPRILTLTDGGQPE